MKLFYKQNFGAALLAVMIAGTACGQKTKTTIKTITIIDGDTTVNEEIISDKDFAMNDKDEKKTIKIISSNGDSAELDETIKIFTDENNNGEKKTITKPARPAGGKIIVMDDGGNIKTTETENGYSYEIEIDENGKKEKKVSTEANTKAGNGKQKIVKMYGPGEHSNTLPLKNINIDVDAKTQVLKLDISSESSETMNVVVMDENGKQVFYDSQKGDKYKKEIKLGKKGVYFLSIIQNKKVLNERIVVE